MINDDIFPVTEQMFEYLPYGSDEKEREYLGYLKLSCLKNFENGLYQFSFIAANILYMSFVLNVIWQGNKFNIEKINEIICKDCGGKPYSSPYILSTVNEINLIKYLLQYGIHDNKLKDFKDPIEWRNNCSHASGFIQYKREEILKHLDHTLLQMKYINNVVNSKISKSFEIFFDGHFKPDDPNSYFPSGYDSIRVYILENRLSMMNLIGILNYNKHIMELSDTSLNTLYKKVFYILLAGWILEKYGELEDINLDVLIMKLRFNDDIESRRRIGDLLIGDLSDIKFMLSEETLKLFPYI